MAFSLSGTVVTQSGQTDSTRDTPQGIIDAGYGTLTGAKTITMGNYHLIVNGFYEDTGWTYIFSSGKRPIAGGSSNWLSGNKVNSNYYGGATFNIYSVGSSDVDITYAGATLFWYGVTIDNKSNQSRLRMQTLNSSSEVVLTLINPSYLVNNVGDTALFELDYYTQFIRHGGNVGLLDKFLHVSNGDNNIYNNAYGSDIVYDGYQPVSLNNGNVNFFSTTGTRNLVLNNPTVDTTKLRIYRNGEVIRINQDLNIQVSSNLPDLSDIDIHVFTQDDSYQFTLTSTTDSDGKATVRLLDIWRGNGNTAFAYLVPSTIVDRRAIKIVFAKYDMEYLVASYDDVIGEGEFSAPVFRASDTDITELNKATVDAYTSLDPLDKIKDRAKSWNLDPANIQVPTIDDQLFTANGSELVLHTNWSLVIDGTAADVFSPDAATRIITIKAASLDAGTKFKTIRAQGTGTITAANSELITVGYIDAYGDSFIDFISALEPTDTWKVFTAEANRDGNTSEVGTGNGTQNYRFNFTAATTLYLRIVRASTGAIIPINLSVSQSGSQAISFDPSIIAQQTNALVGQINDTIKYLPSEVFVDATSSQTGIGSHKEPYNMIADAVTYANANNVDAIVLLSNITLNAALMSHDVRASKAGVEVVFGGQNIANSQFINLHLEGVATGSFESDKCHIHDVTGLEGNHYNGCYGGTNAVNGTCHIFDSSAKSDNTTFDLTGKTNVDLEIHSMTGQVTITGSTSSTNKIRIASKGCSVILAASNTAGIFTIDTAASLQDNTAGASVNANNVLSPSTIARSTDVAAVTTEVASIKSITDNIVITGGKVESTLGAEKVTLIDAQKDIIEEAADEAKGAHNKLQ
ncbi:hypothetical protein N9H19_02600 [Flavobacteriales bacterium]|nr:hypothetical protein [Flavobacteriales bacterium]